MISEKNFKDAQDLMHEIDRLKKNKLELEKQLSRADETDHKYTLVRDAHMSTAEEVLLYFVNKRRLLTSVIQVIQQDIDDKIYLLNNL